MTDNHERVSAEVRLGAHVRAARVARGWSQEELASRLAEHAGVKLGQSGIVRLEKGDRPTRLDEALAIARFLGLDLTTLLRPSEPPTEIEVREAHAKRVAAQRALRDAEAGFSEADVAWRTIAAEALTASDAFRASRVELVAFDWIRSIGEEARAFDRADPAKLKTDTDTVALPDGERVEVRALAPDEVMHVKALQDLLDKEIYIVAAGMTAPKLSKDDVAQWARNSAPGDMGAVLRAIAELSGVMGGDSDG